MRYLLPDMRIRIIHVGKTSSKALGSFIAEFQKRIGRFGRLELVAVDGASGRSMGAEEVKKREGEAIMKRLKGSETLVLLDEKGEHYDSISFSKQMEKWSSQNGAICFVIGGAHGHHDILRSEAKHLLSLSSMTFNHELALSVLIEQIYRGLTIKAGHPYHKV